MNKYVSRVTSSARGELFNPLMYPFLISTFSYGIGFLCFTHSAAVGQSSLYAAMLGVGPSLAPAWGAVAILTIVVGFTFLLCNLPPAGKVSGLVGFMVWVFASLCWLLTGGYLAFFAVGLPNMIFWIWQYLSLSKFRREDAEDALDSSKHHVLD